MLHVIILAGGSGTRLWPASRVARPKHLLVFEEHQTLLQATLERIAPLAPLDRTWIVTSPAQAGQMADLLPQFDTEHIWAEPKTRNTAASIGWAAVKLHHIDPDAVMVVLPADHIIKPADAFCKVIQCAAEHVDDSPQTLVTIGVKPTFPATTYGYIQRGAAFNIQQHTAYGVLQFCEKPNRETAEHFCQSGGYYWNAGIFIWKAERILTLLRHYEQSIGTLLDQIAKALGTPEEKSVTEEAFRKMKSISIDYAVMERAENIAVLEAAFEWNDVGTWSALDRLYAEQKDNQGNLAVASQVLAIDSSGCTVRCDDPGHLVALVGLKDVVVIQTADATLIARKDQEESVRHVAEKLRQRKESRWS